LVVEEEQSLPSLEEVEEEEEQSLPQPEEVEALSPSFSV
jgi:hypothetical protein